MQTTQLPQQQLRVAANQQVPEKADEGTLRIDVPANAAEIPISLLIKGELLDVKTKKTLATADAPALATRIATPFAVEPLATLTVQPGVRQLLPVKVTRLGAFKEPIQLVVSGIPANFRTGPASLTVSGDQHEVQVPIMAPVNQKPTEVKVQVVASWKTTPPINLPAQTATVSVIDAPPPRALEVFEDGEDFVGVLTEGTGKAALETNNAYSGKEAILVSGSKSRNALPVLGVAIAEKPQPGQYRYLRFAWKKKTAGTLALQVSGSKLRYIAGVDKTSIQVAEQPPGEWTLVTRDLFADGGAFTLTGLSLSATDGEGLFDHVYLAQDVNDFPKH
jgi:hypothetical protein